MFSIGDTIISSYGDRSKGLEGVVVDKSVVAISSYGTLLIDYGPDFQGHSGYPEPGSLLLGSGHLWWVSPQYCTLVKKQKYLVFNKKERCS